MNTDARLIDSNRNLMIYISKSSHYQYISISHKFTFVIMLLHQIILNKPYPLIQNDAAAAADDDDDGDDDDDDDH